MKILLTTTSFQDTPGAHHDMLAQTGWEIIAARGPLNETDTLALVGDVDGYICGDDAITRRVGKGTSEAQGLEQIWHRRGQDRCESLHRIWHPAAFHARGQPYHRCG